ncbi:hypothetical protein [Neorhizobium sp. DT-125]|uniref:hypothetical protein n=1 Tax=Neorhizobium sp. DT-125 TaxID=3396163 RepID=UPI003F19FAD1
MSTERLVADPCPRRFLIAFVIALLSLVARPALGEDFLAGVVADGKPWEMFIVKRRASNILVLRPDGGGTISDNIATIHPTWRAVPGGICIRPEQSEAERCLALTRTTSGIAASQMGKTVWILKR